MDLTFEWDDAKADKVFLERNIHFAAAAKIFYDDNLILWHSQQQTISEDRFVAVGKVGPRYVAVVFTFRENAIRIVTARPARRKEREHYDTREVG